jgi:hypothetical protein
MDLFPYVVLFVSGEVTGALGTCEELAGASVAHIGLEAPRLLLGWSLA